MATPSVAPARPLGSASPQAVRKMKLASVTTEAQHLPNIILVHGPPGVGKTSLAGHFPSPVFLMTRGELGAIMLMQYNQIPKVNHWPEPAESWQEILDAIDELTEGQHEHKTLVIDTVNGAERLCHEMVCARDYGGDWGKQGFEGFAAGYRTSVNDWRHLIGKLQKLRDKRRMTILGLCHTATKNNKNPLGADFDQFLPSLYKDTWAVTNGESDMVLYCQQEIFSEKESKLALKGKAKAGGRIMYTDGNAGFVAKNRAGLPAEIDMGTNGKEAFTNLMHELTKAKNVSK